MILCYIIIYNINKPCKSVPDTIKNTYPFHFVMYLLRGAINPSWSLSYFSFQLELPDWNNKDQGMCYPVSGMMHIKDPLLLIGKSSPRNAGS